MNYCLKCLSSTRVFNVCVACHGKPGASVTDPTLRWFLDTLAEEPEYALTNDQCYLIRMAGEGKLLGGHLLEKASVESAAALALARSPEAKAGGRFIGTPPKGKWEGPVRCVRVRELEPHPQYGPRFLFVFETNEAGQVEPATLVWFTGEGGKFNPEEGEECVMKATVVRHSVYDGVKQTTIQRPKRVEPETDEEPPQDDRPDAF